jgi:type I restriction enzyme M protein
LTDEAVKTIADGFLNAKPVDSFITVISREEAAKNDFNLSPSRYLTNGENGSPRELPDIVRELRQLTEEQNAADKVLGSILRTLGL